MREISNIYKALVSVLIMCVAFLFSSHSSAKNDTQFSEIVSHVNVDFSVLELNIDDNDSSDPVLLYKNNINDSMLGSKVVMHGLDYAVVFNFHTINVRAPPSL